MPGCSWRNIQPLLNSEIIRLIFFPAMLLKVAESSLESLLVKIKMLLLLLSDAGN